MSDSNFNAIRIAYYRQYGYIKAGCITALLVDYLETIPLEIRYIWYGKKTLVTTVYFLARYTVFLSYVFGALHTLKWANIPVERCFLTYILTSVTHMVNSAFCEGLLYAQVYAFSGGKRLMGVYLLFQFIALHCAKFTLQTRYSIRVGAFEILDLTEDVHCIAITPSQDASSHLGGVFIAQTVGLYVLIAITLWIHRFGYRDLKSALLTVLIRNGMIYFVTVTALSSLAIAFSYVSKGANIFLAPIIGISAPILGTRFILHLRDQARRNQVVDAEKWYEYEPETNVLDSMQFSNETRHTTTTG